MRRRRDATESQLLQTRSLRRGERDERLTLLGDLLDARLDHVGIHVPVDASAFAVTAASRTSSPYFTCTSTPEPMCRSSSSGRMLSSHTARRSPSPTSSLRSKWLGPCRLHCLA